MLTPDYASGKSRARGIRQRRLDEPAWQRLGHACSETLFGSLKVKGCLASASLPGATPRMKPLAWLLCDNQSRLHLTLNCTSPMQFEQHGLVDQAAGS